MCPQAKWWGGMHATVCDRPTVNEFSSCWWTFTGTLLYFKIYTYIFYVQSCIYFCVNVIIWSYSWACAYLCIDAGGSMCLLEINLMVGNSIRPCCWIHPVQIHQQSGGHLHSSSEGTFFTAQTKGRRNMPALWTHFRSSHLCRRGTASGGSRKMAKLTKTVKVKADPCEIMHVIYS